jgi:hypothetical protein
MICVAILTVPAAKMTVSNRIWTATHTLPAQWYAPRAHMRPRIEIDKYFFIIGEKRSIFTINLLGRIPRKWMGRYVEMDKWSRSQYFDEVLPWCLEAETLKAGRCFGSGIRWQNPPPSGIKTTIYCDCDRLSIYTCLPMHFSGMRPSKFKVKILLFPPIIKKYLSISMHGLIWALGAPRRRVCASVQMRLDIVILAAGTVRIATPHYDKGFVLS